jgi:hypothetical protein
MLLSEYLDTDKLGQHINSGLVHASTHPDKNIPLAIYTYTRKAFYTGVWDDVIRKCRGLIVDTETDFVVSRPFPKFFGINDEAHPETLECNLPMQEPEISEKINGNLGIFWKYGIHWGIASKSSFTSDHAKWATEWMEDHVEHDGKFIYPLGYTPLFEMVCQDIQLHAVKYDRNELVLISLIKNETGEEASPITNAFYASNNGLNSPEIHYKKLADVINEDREGHEGYVLTYRHYKNPPLKIKIKHPWFLQARQEFYAAQKDVTHLASEEFKGTLYKEILSKSRQIVLDALACCSTRKEYAEWFNKDENKLYATICFAMLDEDGSHKEAINKLIGIMSDMEVR